MTASSLIEQVESFVREYMSAQKFDPSHDFAHVDRVRRLALTLAASEIQNHPSLDMQVIEVAALLHDVNDFKYASENVSTESILRKLLIDDLNCSEEFMDKVLLIVENLSFRKEIGMSEGMKQHVAAMPEFCIVQDADRLDAIGAIGIARCFSFGAARNRPFYDPEIPPYDANRMTQAEYDSIVKDKKGITLNHFEEKLFRLKDMMKTETGRKMAEQRHNVMVDFVDQFKAEWTCTR